MESFELYFEKNFLSRFFIDKDAEQLLSEKTRRTASVYIKQLKDILKQKGYTIHKHSFAYTVRKDRKVGLSKKDTADYPYNKEMKHLNKKYIKTLFTLAHEVGHVLQWNDETDMKQRFEEFFDERQKLSSEVEFKKLQNLQIVWYELDAWVKGMEFIPIEFKPEYKKYALYYYTTYIEDFNINLLPPNYKSNVLLNQLLYRLNYDELTSTPSK
jgi:hypothetical protein